MKKFLHKAKVFTPLFLTAFIMVLPLITLADQGTTFVPGDQGTTPINNGNTATCSGGTCTLQNPLAVSNFCDLIKIVLQAILMIGMPIAVVFLVIVGFKFIMAQGKPEAIEKAKENLLHTVIGIAVFLGAWAIAKIIASTLAGLGVSAVNQCAR